MNIRRVRIIISFLALFCFISMYIPVIAPRYPAAGYYMSDSSAYFYNGEYYLAKEYWCITDYVFANFGVLGRLVLSRDQAMLLLWALLSVRGDAKYDLIIALVNMIIVTVATIVMLRNMWACQWPVLIVIALIMIASVVLSAALRER